MFFLCSWIEHQTLQILVFSQDPILHMQSCPISTFLCVFEILQIKDSRYYVWCHQGVLCYSRSSLQSAKFWETSFMELFIWKNLKKIFQVKKKKQFCENLYMFTKDLNFRSKILWFVSSKIIIPAEQYKKSAHFHSGRQLRHYVFVFFFCTPCVKVYYYKKSYNVYTQFSSYYFAMYNIWVLGFHGDRPPFALFVACIPVWASCDDLRDVNRVPFKPIYGLTVQ